MKTETELMKQIRQTQLKDVFKWELKSRSEQVNVPTNLYNNLIPFLMMQTGLDDVMSTPVNGISSEITNDIWFSDYIQRDDLTRLGVYNNGESYIRMYDKLDRSMNQIMNVTTYKEKQLEELSPLLLELFPFMIIRLILMDLPSNNDAVKEAITNYIQHRYVDPLKEKVPGIDCTFDISLNRVNFHVDVTSVEDSNILKVIRTMCNPYYEIIVKGDD